MKIRMKLFVQRVLLTIWLITVSTAAAQAAPKSVYVSADGSDANNCSQTAPCRQISRALDVVASGGSVLILSSGEYDRITIGKSVNIVADPGVTPIVVGGSQLSAVRIENYSSAISVRLSGLEIVSTGFAAIGVYVSGLVNDVRIENCAVTGGENGVWVTAPGGYSIVNSRFYGAVMNLRFGVSTGTGLIDAIVDNSRFDGGGAGVFTGRNSRVTVRNSSATNTGTGFWASQSTARMLLESCLANGNHGDGVYADTSAYIRLSNSVISNNQEYGIRINVANVKSFGTNRIFNNKLGDISGTMGSVPQQ